MSEPATPTTEHWSHGASALKFHLFGYDWLIWPGELVGLVMIVFMFWAFWRAQADKRNPINLAEMFVWPGTKHTSLAMVMAFIASMISCWVVIDQELKGKLTGEIFVAFLGILVAGKAGTEIVNAWRAKNPAPSMTSETSEHTEKKTVIATPPPAPAPPVVPVAPVPPAKKGKRP